MTDKLLATALLTLALGCNNAGGGKNDTDDTDATGATAALVGLYRVNSESKDDACSGNFVDLAVPIPFFELRANGAALEFYVCRSESDCDETPDGSRTLTQKKNGDWVHVSEGASYNGSDPAAHYCEVFRRLTTFTDKGNDKYTLDASKFQDTLQSQSYNSDQDCADALADWTPSAEATESQCERIQATKVK